MTPAESRPFLELLRSPEGSLSRSLEGSTQAAALAPTDTLQSRSGRAVTLHEAPRGGEDFLHISSPEGKVELSIRFTAEGPVLSFDAVQLDMKSAGRVQLDCEELVLRGRKSVELASDAELSVRSQENMHIEGKNVLINCDRPCHAPAPVESGEHAHGEGAAPCCHKPVP